MSCPHVESLDLRPPQATQSVYREDCVQCFDSIDDTSGLDVCLSCFNGGCAGERGHNALHYQTSGHPLVLNIKRTRKHVQRDEPPQKLTKVAVVAETEADKYDTAAKVKCLACGVHEINQNSPKLQTAVDGVLKAMTFASQQEIKAWELELQPCEHTLCLQQHPGREIASQDLGHCSSCELKENLWLCLECGNLGCGRQQMGGAAGNSHGLAHATESGHGVAVKLGSITAEGTADVYCYICNDERIDTELTAHLAHWGINIAGRQKTEKSLMEMQVEHNLKYDFSMTTEDGKELKPLFGPGFTGIKNIGNTCYLASTMQCLFDLPEFQTRYFHPQEPPPPSNAPAEDLETQLRKIADGILSGRYSQPNPVDSSTSTPQEQQPQHQEGLNPAMFKHLVGRGHEEFSTMRQQDAFEFLLHLFKLISMTNRVQPQQDPVQSFRFAMEQRLQCIECKKVRYKVDEQDNISVPVPVRRLPATTGVDGDKKDEFESVSLKECLDIFTATDTVELTCPSCGSKAGFLKSSKFKTLPTNLAVNARRFELVNWVPTKLDIPVQVGDAPFDMSTYLSTGLQEGEIELPEETQPAANAFVPNEAAIGQLEMMGFPRPRCEKALHATGNADAETAMNWLFAHMEDPDIDEPLVLQTNAPSQGDDQGKIDQLAEMGIGAPQARKALRECNGSVERAIDWVFSHPDDQGDFEADMPDQPTADASPKGLPGSSDRPANYQLESIACHKGSSIHAGHYVAFVKREIPGEPGRQWVLYNDEKVVKAANIEEMKKFAYVYFFRRQ